MKVNRDEIIRVEKYQKLKKELKQLEEDFLLLCGHTLCACRSFSTPDFFNNDYENVLKRHIKLKIKILKRKIKEMEN